MLTLWCIDHPYARVSRLLCTLTVDESMGAISPTRVNRVRILKDWSWPALERQTPNHTARWDGIEFVLGEGDDYCDVTVVLNNRLRQEARIASPANCVWVLMQEPYARGFTDWMVEHLDAFALVLTHHPKGVAQPTRVSHPALPWHVNRDYDELSSSTAPEKSREVSWILGNGRGLRGHLTRMRFFKKLRAAEPRVELFGRAIRSIEDKWDGLAPYRFSIAVENSRSPDYWTEKIADCFLSWTVPLYWGAPNIGDYFPQGAFITLPIHDTPSALKVIRGVLDESEREWRRRLEALAEARRLVLDRYQLFPHLASLVRSCAPQHDAPLVYRVPAYKRSLRASACRSVRKLLHTVGWL